MFNANFLHISHKIFNNNIFCEDFILKLIFLFFQLQICPIQYVIHINVVDATEVYIENKVLPSTSTMNVKAKKSSNTLPILVRNGTHTHNETERASLSS